MIFKGGQTNIKFKYFDLREFYESTDSDWHYLVVKSNLINAIDIDLIRKDYEQKTNTNIIKNKIL